MTQPRRLRASLVVPAAFLVVGRAAGRRRRIEPAGLEASSHRAVHVGPLTQAVGHCELRRDVAEALFRVDGDRRSDDRLIEGVQQRLLALAIAAHAHRHVEPAPVGERAAPVNAHAVIVEFGLRRVLIDRKVHERRQHERSEAVHGVLGVILREEEDAALPGQCQFGRQRDCGIFRRRGAEFLRELMILLVVRPPDQGKRRVVEVGEVVGFPPDEAGR